MKFTNFYNSYNSKFVDFKLRKKLYEELATSMYNKLSIFALFPGRIYSYLAAIINRIIFALLPYYYCNAW